MINIKNIGDNECFKWCLVRYSNPPDHHPARITKADKDFAKALDLKTYIRDIHKIENKNSIGINIFGYQNKEKYPIYVSKNVVKKNMLTYYKTLCPYQRF